MFGPTERSSVSVIGSVDPRSVIELELVHRLASLMWRLRRASAIETGLFEIQGELSASRAGRTPSRAASQPGDSSPPRRPMAIAKAPARADQTIRRSATENRCQRPCTRRSDQGRGPAASPNVSCAFPILTRPCLIASARYEARLWRQAAQTIWTLDAMRQPPPPMRQRLRHRAALFAWDRER